MKKPPYLPLSVTHEVRDTCLCLHTQRAARLLARRFDEALKPVGLTHGQFSLLIALNRPAPPTIGDVAELLGMDRTTLTAKLKPLQRRGLVKVISDPADKRARRLTLTQDSAAVLADALPIWRSTHRQIDREGTKARVQRLRGDLQSISDTRSRRSKQ